MAGANALHQSGENTSWRRDLITQLHDRNRTETRCFYNLISLHCHRLFDNANTLRTENLQLSIANDKLRCEEADGISGSGSNAALEAKLLAQADELMALHRRRGEHTQQIINLKLDMFASVGANGSVHLCLIYDKAIDFYRDMVSCAELLNSNKLGPVLNSLAQTIAAVYRAKRDIHFCSVFNKTFGKRSSTT